jgi:hypothetical protein
LEEIKYINSTYQNWNHQAHQLLELFIEASKKLMRYQVENWLFSAKLMAKSKKDKNKLDPGGA